MLVCLALGILGGIVYFVFGLPIYYSRSLIQVTILALPINSDSGKTDSTTPSPLSTMAVSLRNFQQKLQSDMIQKRVAIKLGVATAGDSPESIRQFALPRVDIGFADADHLGVAVYSPYPHVVREYSHVLIEEYENSEKEMREAYRKQAVETYVREMSGYEAKLDEHRNERLQYEKEKSLAELFIKQNSLAQVPKDIVLAKDRIRRMEEARDYLKTHGNEMDTVAKLSLLNAVRSEKPVEVGSVVREFNGSIQNVPPRPLPQPQDIVVGPPQVESLEPWQELEKQMRQIQGEISRKSQIFQAGNPAMLKLNTELSTIQDKLKAELDVAEQRFDVELATVTEKLRSLEAKLPEYNSVTAEYERKKEEYNILEQSQLNFKKALTDMRLNVAKLEYGAEHERVLMELSSVVSMRDTNPVSPNKSKLVLIAFGLGLALSLGIPSLLLFTDTTANRLEQMESQTGLKGLGIVPLSDSATLEDIFRAPVLDSNIPSFLLENFRIIRNNLTLSSSQPEGPRVIMVTSARPGEGKTSLAANLAWSFHTMGERTLLVDCDLRRGRVAIVTHTPNKEGLSGLLTDLPVSNGGIITTDCVGLDVVPRGPIVSGATELLCQQKFQDLISEWRSKYDRVILDTPPVLGLSETSGLQRVTDGVILVVRAHKTRSKDVADATDMLRRAGAHIFGFVLNAVDLSKIANHYNYYYYSSQYYEAMENPTVTA